MKLKYLATLGLCAFGYVGSALAVPITFIHTGSGTGSIGSTAFTNAFFTITETADTNFRQDCGTGGACFFINDLSASIKIGEFSYSFQTPTRTFVDQDLAFVGFGRAGENGQDLLGGPTDVQLANYSMLSSIGPITGSGDLMQFNDPFDPVLTSGGRLLFDDQSGPFSFQATVTVVPEPSTYLLLIAGLVAVGLRHSKKKVRTPVSVTGCSPATAARP